MEIIEFSSESYLDPFLWLPSFSFCHWQYWHLWKLMGMLNFELNQNWQEHYWNFEFIEYFWSLGSFQQIPYSSIYYYSLLLLHKVGTRSQYDWFELSLVLIWKFHSSPYLNLTFHHKIIIWFDPPNSTSHF